ncbi:MAG: hypothetical protein AAF721_31385, partial [Myxococcota bacterium]
ASRYFKGQGTAKDAKRGKTVLRRGCDAGNPKRCGQLGMLMLGLVGGDELAGVEDVPAGLELLDRSCTKYDYRDACLLLAKLYGTGTKVPEDRSAAAQYHRRACPSDDAPGCTSLEQHLR